MKHLKKITIIPVITLLSLTLVISCKKEIKKEPAKYSVEQKTVTVKWTGYKTTAKVGVKGEFKEITITNTKTDTTAVGALDGAKFEIPISSLNSGNEERDGKLKQLFFGIMDATVSLTGTLHLKNDGTGNIDLLMNGVQNKIPVTYIDSGQMIELEGTMNLDDWNAQSALASLAKACFEKHKGDDGVSKTWSEVTVGAAIYLKKK
ncbi:MAG TPA: YceI family protein [Flavobacteriia bacterium]|nr:YceI family protein [Flavobacteriia bacterium]